MAVSYDYYRIFYYVGKYGSFTRAAKVLGSNQPNVTRAMNNLEAELGCKLFVRSRKGISLTPEGEKLLSHVEAAYEQLQLGEAEIAAERSLQSGYLSIAVSEIALHGFMLPILQKFCSAYPGIQIQLRNHSTTQGILAVSRGTVELAVVSSPTGALRPLTETPVKTFQDILVAGKHYRELASATRSLKDLSAYPLICLGKTTKTYEFYSDFFTVNGLPLKASIEAATTDQILPMVCHDIGLGFVPYEFAKDALLRKEIVQIPLREKIPARQICLVRDRSKPLSIAASVLEKMILEF